MDNEQRLSKLKEEVATLKTEVAIKEDQKERLLEELKEHNITNVKEASKIIDSITKEIDEKETLKNQELEKAESYLERYNV